MTRLEFDETELRQQFDRNAFTIRHNLSAHPLFKTERLLELAAELPENEIEYNPGALSIEHDPGRTPTNGLTPEETIRRIRDCDSWLVLKRIQRNPEYDALLRECLEDLRPALPYPHSEMVQREAFVFLSSPGSVTPFHMDPEENFLLQIRGEKTMYVWDPLDRDVISEADLEEYFAREGHRNLRYDERFEDRAAAFTIKPGDGLHVPMAVPHWVKNGDDVSVSFSITFRTPVCFRRERLYQINSRLRGLGWTPHPVGQSQLRDNTKLAVFDAVARARRVVRSVLS